MKRNALIIIAALLVLMTAVLLLRPDNGKDGESSAWLPELGGELERLQEIEIITYDETVVLHRGPAGWIVASAADYPADIATLAELTDGLREARLVERKTARAENHARLSLALPPTEGSGTRVIGRAETVLFDVVLGKRGDSQPGQFVRRADDDQVWLIHPAVPVADTSGDYLARAFLDVPAERVLGARFTNASGDLVITAGREFPEERLVIETPLPEGRELRYEGIGDEIAGALADLRLMSVAAHDDARFEGASTAEFVLTGDASIQVQAVQVDGKYWLHITTVNPAGDASLQDISAWDFEVNRVVHERLVRDLDSLLAPLPPPAAEMAEEAGEAMP